MTPPVDPKEGLHPHVSPSQVLILRVALALLNDARQRGAFETDARALAMRTAELEVEFTGYRSDWNPSSEPAIQASPLTTEEIHLSAVEQDRVVRFKTLRLDGVLHSGGAVLRVSLDAANGAELSPSELEQLTQPQAELENLPEFRGDHFLGAIAAPPQQGSGIQILAAELFIDGLIVHASFNREVEAPEADGKKGPPLRPMQGLSVEDDLGTEYHAFAESKSGGCEVSHEMVQFVPAVPAGARILYITTYSSTVELIL